MDPISITAMIISIIAAIGAIIGRLRFKKCHMGCIDSDCVRTPNNSPPETPTQHQKIYLENPPIYLNNISV
jgi:hypothetical protein